MGTNGRAWQGISIPVALVMIAAAAPTAYAVDLSDPQAASQVTAAASATARDLSATQGSAAAQAPPSPTATLRVPASADAQSDTPRSEPQAESVPTAISAVGNTKEQVQTRGDVRRKKLTAEQKAIATHRMVWGFAGVGADSVIKGASVSVKSLSGHTLRAHIITKSTSKSGFFAVSRLGLPKRFVVEVAGGKLVVKAGKRTKTMRSNARLMATVGKPKAKVRDSRADISLGTTIAARIGLERWHNAGNAKAIARTKKALRLPAWSTLGTYDRLLGYYVSAHTVTKKSKNGKKLQQVIDAIVRQGKKNKHYPTLGEGERTKYRPYRDAKRSANTRGGLTTGLSLSFRAIGLALNLDQFFTGTSTTQIADILDQISQQLVGIQNSLNTIQTQLTTLQDEMQNGFSTLSLQATSNQYANLVAQNNATEAKIATAMNDLQELTAQTQAGNSFLLPYLQATTVSDIQAATTGGVAQTLQSNLIGSNSAPGVLQTLWNLILQQRATQAPAAQPAQTTASGSYALASTKLLTHEDYDAFEPVASYWYMQMAELGQLTASSALQVDSQGNAEEVWTTGSNNQLTLTQNAQMVINYVMNGTLTADASPAAGSFNSYLDVISAAVPQQSVGQSEALDTSTSTMWGNFGTTTWNSASDLPAETSPNLDMPPTTTASCNGTQQRIRLDQQFFPTVNGTAGNCAWPGAPVGGPAGSGDTATNWQMLSTDTSTTIGTFNATLGSLDGSGSTGLYSQLNMGNNNQNANPSLKIQGANFLDFTYPSLFPDNQATVDGTGIDWGRLSYASGQWTQYMWSLPQYPIFGFFPMAGAGSYTPVAPRYPHGPFLAFDAANPMQPDMTGYSDPTGSTGAGALGVQYGSAFYPSMYAQLSYAQNPWPQDWYGHGAVDAALTDRVAGFGAPWWPSANLSTDGDISNYNVYGPPTPGCAVYSHQYDANGYLLASPPAQGCTANIIGTRPATVSDYLWNQPASIG